MIEQILGAFEWVIDLFRGHLIKKEEIKQRHWNKLVEEVLKPWLDKVRDDINNPYEFSSITTKTSSIINKKYEIINQHLFQDLLMHFPELRNLKRSLDAKEAKLSKIAKELENNFKNKYGLNDYDIYGKSVISFIINGNTKFARLEINEDYDYGSSFMYGNLLITRAKKESTEEIKSDLERLHIGSKGKELRSLHKQIEITRDNLRSEIEFVLAKEHKLKKCKFII